MSEISLSVSGKSSQADALQEVNTMSLRALSALSGVI